MSIDKDTYVGDAVNTLTKALQEDESFAHAWHCNIAMAFFDSFPENHPYPRGWKHEVANEGASRVMRMVFNTRTSNDMLDNVATSSEVDVAED